MEHLIRFEVDATRYFLWRRKEWCFEVTVPGVHGETVNLDLEISFRGAPTIAIHRSFRLTSVDGLRFEMKRTRRRHDDLFVSLDALRGSEVMLRWDLPEGVEFRRMEDDGDDADA